MKLSVILPCFNEEENVKQIQLELTPVLEKIGYDFEILVVDDGSTDNSVKELNKIKNSSIRVLKHKKNLGLGAALRTGIANAEGDLIATLDIDFTFHPKFIPSLLEILQKNPDADFVIGSPQLGSYTRNIPFLRIILSKLANALYSVLLEKKVSSVNQIFRLYKADQVKKISLQSNGFEINAEILFRLTLQGKKFVEVPVVLTQRLYGVSHLNYRREIIRHFLLILKIIKWKILAS